MAPLQRLRDRHAVEVEHQAARQSALGRQLAAPVHGLAVEAEHHAHLALRVLALTGAPYSAICSSVAEGCGGAGAAAGSTGATPTNSPSGAIAAAGPSCALPLFTRREGARRRSPRTPHRSPPMRATARIQPRATSCARFESSAQQAQAAIGNALGSRARERTPSALASRKGCIANGHMMRARHAQIARRKPLPIRIFFGFAPNGRVSQTADSAGATAALRVARRELVTAKTDEGGAAKSAADPSADRESAPARRAAEHHRGSVDRQRRPSGAERRGARSRRACRERQRGRRARRRASAPPAPATGAQAIGYRSRKPIDSRRTSDRAGSRPRRSAAVPTALETRGSRASGRAAMTSRGYRDRARAAFCSRSAPCPASSVWARSRCSAAATRRRPRGNQRRSTPRSPSRRAKRSRKKRAAEQRHLRAAAAGDGACRSHSAGGLDRRRWPRRRRSRRRTRRPFHSYGRSRRRSGPSHQRLRLPHPRSRRLATEPSAPASPPQVAPERACPAARPARVAADRGNPRSPSRCRSLRRSW